MNISNLDNAISESLKTFDCTLNTVKSNDYAGTLKKIDFQYSSHYIEKMVSLEEGKSNISDSIPKNIGLYVFSSSSSVKADAFIKEYKKFKEENSNISLPSPNKHMSGNIIYVGSAINLRSRLTAHLNFPKSGASTYALHLGKLFSYCDASKFNLKLEIFYFNEEISKSTQLAVKELTEGKLYSALHPRIGNNR